MFSKGSILKNAGIKILMFSIYVFFIASLFLINSCNKDKKEAELALIYEYIKINNIDAVETESGLQYAQTGFSTPETYESDYPVQGDTVITIGKSYVLSSANNLLLFKETTLEAPERYVYLEDPVIEGWEEMIGMMKKDMTALVIVPSKLAYKGDRVGVIPPYSPLVFKIRILDIKSSGK